MGTQYAIRKENKDYKQLETKVIIRLVGVSGPIRNCGSSQIWEPDWTEPHSENEKAEVALGLI